MIHFACHCNHVFDLPEEMAGKQLQCPNCQRLVDVPSHDELAQLSDDGTFLVGEAAQEHPQAFERMRVAYAKEKIDEDGLEIDLRQTHEELLAAGTEANPNEYEENPRAPKYDPETGELVRPLDVVDDLTVPPPHPSQVPMASTTLSYATPDLAEQTSLLFPFIQLLSPINLAAMFFVLLAQCLFFITAIVPFVTALAFFVFAPALIAHYANVVDEIGMEERDELPRFMRHVSLVDDIWLPFVHVFLAWMVCFGPADFFEMVWTHHHWSLAAGVITYSSLSIVGLVFFPAVVLTTITSGSISNLRPDRVLGVIALIGPRYAFMAILYPIAIGCYSIGVSGPTLQIFAFMTGAKHLNPILMSALPYPLLVAGIFLMHYFAWLLGLSYRNLHRKFPWIYHKFERVIPGVNAPRYARHVHGLPIQRKRTDSNAM